MAIRQAFKIIVIGDPFVGKTSLMGQFVTKKFSSTPRATIGYDFMKKDVMVGDRLVVLQIWDTAGQGAQFKLVNSYYRGTDCCVLVFDVTKSLSFDHLEYWHEEFLTYANPLNRETFPFVVIGNKVDIADSRVITTQKAQEWCQERGIPYFETSAKEGIQVDQAFEEVAKLALEHFTPKDMDNIRLQTPLQDEDGGFGCTGKMC